MVVQVVGVSVVADDDKRLQMFLSSLWSLMMTSSVVVVAVDYFPRGSS